MQMEMVLVASYLTIWNKQKWPVAKYDYMSLLSKFIIKI